MSGNSIALLVIGGAVLAVALALGGILWRIGRLKRAVAIAKAWPTVPGRVIAGEIVQRSISLPRGGRGVSYGAILDYEYEIDGRRWRSRRYSLSGPAYFSFERRARRLLAQFPAGMAVTVSYDPAAPESGVIFVGAPAIFAFRFVFWFMLALMSWLIGGVLLFEPMFGPEPLIRL
ncbi:MAG: DUF3592 domain-containing protein [Rhodospirillaceae bacterium]|nr:DUF3592 domain-containing protein [Rhodospirillaceae bacterium]